MKKIFFTILSVSIMIAFSVQSVFADDILTQDKSKLPAQARTFIDEHFANKKISFIKIEDDFLEPKTYKVAFADGVEVEFDKKGNWTEIDCKANAVPAALIPAKIKTYIQSNFSGQVINQIERKRRGYEVEMNNDLNVEFDKDANFLRLDD